MLIYRLLNCRANGLLEQSIASKSPISRSRWRLPCGDSMNATVRPNSSRRKLRECYPLPTKLWSTRDRSLCCRDMLVPADTGWWQHCDGVRPCSDWNFRHEYRLAAGPCIYLCGATNEMPGRCGCWITRDANVAILGPEDSDVMSPALGDGQPFTTNNRTNHRYRDRGPDCSGAPPTPPGMRVRTRRFNL